MPRLSIAGHGGQLIAMLLAVMLAAPVMAAAPTTSQPSVETLMYHLTNDRDVGKARKLYRSSVNTAMLYSQCPAEYHVDDAKRIYMDRVLHADELKLRSAFTAAHQKLMYKLPDNSVLAAVEQYIVDFRNTEAIALGKLIHNSKKRCDQPTLERLDQAYEQRRLMETHAAAKAAADEEKRRQLAPAVVESEQQNKQSH